MLYHRHSLNYWGEMILHRGVLGGEFLRGHSPEKIMSRWVEYSGHNGNPLVKVYSQRQARALFKDFREVATQIEQLTRPELGVLGNISDTLFERLRRRVGWNIIITAKK